MKKSLTILTILLALFLRAQNFTTLQFNEKDLKSEDISLSKSWRVTLENNTIKLTQGRISNFSNADTRSLYLSNYISEEAFDTDKGSYTGILLSQVSIKPIAKNSSIIDVNIESSLNYTPKDGNYYQILVLSDVSGNVLDILQLPDLVVTNNILQLSINIKNDEETDSSNTNDFKPIRLIVAENSQLSLNGDWTIKISPYEWSVKLLGGSIENSSATPSGKLFLDVYLVNGSIQETEPLKEFNGYYISSIPVFETIKENSKLTGVSVNSNLRTIVPQGQYQIVLALSEEVDNNKVIVATRKFDNLITL